jgi:Protein of unknown function (DUF2853)
MMADIQEHKDTVAKYAKVNAAALDGMAKTYRLVLSNKDSQFVACTDQAEKDTVRENFLKKKLGLTASNDALNASVEAACVTMKDDRLKSRLAMYYLLAEKHGKLDMFVK